MPETPKGLLNMSVEQEDEQIVVTIDLRGKPIDSKTGKTLLLASTRGTLTIPDTQVGPVHLGLNLFQYPNERKE